MLLVILFVMEVARFLMPTALRETARFFLLKLTHNRREY